MTAFSFYFLTTGYSPYFLYYLFRRLQYAVTFIFNHLCFQYSLLRVGVRLFYSFASLHVVKSNPPVLGITHGAVDFGKNAQKRVYA